MFKLLSCSAFYLSPANDHRCVFTNHSLKQSRSKLSFHFNGLWTLFGEQRSSKNSWVRQFVNTECHASQCSHGQEAVMEATKNVQRMFFWAAKSRAKSPGAPLTQWHWALNRIYWSSPQKNAKRSRLTLQGDTISVDISASFWVRFGCDLFGVGSATFLQFFCGLAFDWTPPGTDALSSRLEVRARLLISFHDFGNNLDAFNFSNLINTLSEVFRFACF